MKHPIILALGMMAGLAACKDAAVVSSDEIILGPNPALSGGTYSAGGGITVATKFRQIGGLTGICGAWAESTQQSSFTETSAPGVLHSGAVYLGGQKLYQNLNFMRHVNPLADYSGAGANCVRTKRPWQPGDENRVPEVRFPEQVVYKDRSGGGGSVFITFSQTGPGALSKAQDLFGLDLIDTENSRLSRTPALTGGSYSTGGGITLAVELQDVDGIAFVCGAWAESKNQSKSTEGKALQVLASGSVQLNGRTVVRDLRFMQNVRLRGGLGRSPARCTSTGLPWNAGYENQRPGISIPRQIVFQNQGQAVYFEPTGPGA